jgi:hypothetical protein
MGCSELLNKKKPANTYFSIVIGHTDSIVEAYNQFINDFSDTTFLFEQKRKSFLKICERKINWFAKFQAYYDDPSFKNDGSDLAKEFARIAQGEIPRLNFAYEKFYAVNDSIEDEYSDEEFDLGNKLDSTAVDLDNKVNKAIQDFMVAQARFAVRYNFQVDYSQHDSLSKANWDSIYTAEGGNVNGLQMKPIRK